MSDDDSNPYAAPEVKPGTVPGSDLLTARPRRSILRFTAVAFCGLIGGLAFGTGLTVVGCLLYFLVTVHAFDAADEMIPIAAVYLGFGGPWLLAAWYFWWRKDLWGMLACVSGVVIPIPLNLILSSILHG